MALMIARYTGASLALLAFAVAILGGLYAQNPFRVVLSRGLLAMFLFCLIGLVVGRSAQWVIREYQQQRESQNQSRKNVGDEPPAGADTGLESAGRAASSIGT